MRHYLRPPPILPSGFGIGRGISKLARTKRLAARLHFGLHKQLRCDGEGLSDAGQDTALPHRPYPLNTVQAPLEKLVTLAFEVER